MMNKIIKNKGNIIACIITIYSMYITITTSPVVKLGGLKVMIAMIAGSISIAYIGHNLMKNDKVIDFIDRITKL